MSSRLVGHKSVGEGLLQPPGPLLLLPTDLCCILGMDDEGKPYDEKIVYKFKMYAKKNDWCSTVHPRSVIQAWY